MTDCILKILRILHKKTNEKVHKKIPDKPDKYNNKNTYEKRYTPSEVNIPDGQCLFQREYIFLYALYAGLF